MLDLLLMIGLDSYGAYVSAHCLPTHLSGTLPCSLKTYVGTLAVTVSTAELV
jgi:hypothetical protein